LSWSSLLTCLAWEAVPVEYATASIALGIMGPHKPHNYVKVGILCFQSRLIISLTTVSFLIVIPPIHSY
jgi:uncharacterized membrane protein YkgB